VQTPPRWSSCLLNDSTACLTTVRWPLSSSDQQVRSVAPSVGTVFSPSLILQEI
ncbi:hypothetical protein A2U01_0097187, partial [Trifolium medium]|nr:hypothetical protein [Trifolium medium]